MLQDEEAKLKRPIQETPTDINVASTFLHASSLFLSYRLAKEITQSDQIELKQRLEEKAWLCSGHRVAVPFRASCSDSDQRPLMQPAGRLSRPSPMSFVASLASLEQRPTAVPGLKGLRKILSPGRAGSTCRAALGP